MRCTRHPSDLTSTVGVCASCLRERLFSLIAAQARQQAQSEGEDHYNHHRKSDSHHNPPPLIFPRSVSPYICRRSDHSSWSHHNRFYSTPQLAPTFSSSTTTTTTTTTTTKKHKRFSLLSSLFKSSRSAQSKQFEADPRDCNGKPSLHSSTASPISSSSSTSSPSWFSSILYGRRKKHQHHQTRFEEIQIPPPNTSRLRRRTDRGMSPSDQDEHFQDDEGGSEYSSESSPGWRKSTPARRRGQPAPNRNVSGMKFCLSPLVRASPNRHRGQKDGLPPGIVEIGRGVNKCHLSSAASLCANRSRKLADFGRYNYNP